MKAKEIKQKVEEGYIRVLLSMQVQGNQSEAVDKALREQLDELTKKGISIEAKISSPQKMEDTKSWYSQYAEVDILFDDSDKIFDVILDYMVTSLEIIAPKQLTLKSKTHQDRLNDLILKFRETERAILLLSGQNKLLKRELEEKAGPKKKSSN
tara:strand:+ start:1575 stop:2036 length:462 start_codon:yes stop_codon:yes gene_type:complete